MNVSTRLLTINLVIYSILYYLVPCFVIKRSRARIKLLLFIYIDIVISAWSLDTFRSPFLAPIVSIPLMYFLFKERGKKNLNILNFLLINDILGRASNLIGLIISMRIFQLDDLPLCLMLWSIEVVIACLVIVVSRKYVERLRDKQSIFSSRFTSYLLLGLIILFEFSAYLFSNHIFDYSIILFVFLVFMVLQCLVALLLTYLYYRRKMADQAAQAQTLRTEDLALYLDRLEDNRNSIRKIRHDLNDLLTLSQLMVRDQDFDHLTDYLDKLSSYVKEEMPQESPSNLADLQQIEDQDLRYLLMSKLLEWEKAGIPYHFECLYPLHNLPINSFDLLRCLAILLNNANEGRQAADPSTEETIDILMLADDQGLEIQVSNPSPSIDIQAAKQAGFSTKEGHRGLGLTNLEEILSAYPNALLNLSYQEGHFMAQLYLTYL